ncbi:MAG: hypothetical protein ABI551_17455, partial [Polyangiaceae bacterium]
MGGRPAEKKGTKSPVKKRRKASSRSPRQATPAPAPKARTATNDPARRALLTLLELTQTLTDDHPL